MGLTFDFIVVEILNFTQHDVIVCKAVLSWFCFLMNNLHQRFVGVVSQLISDFLIEIYFALDFAKQLVIKSSMRLFTVRTDLLLLDFLWIDWHGTIVSTDLPRLVNMLREAMLAIRYTFGV